MLALMGVAGMTEVVVIRRKPGSTVTQAPDTRTRHPGERQANAGIHRLPTTPA